VQRLDLAAVAAAYPGAGEAAAERRALVSALLIRAAYGGMAFDVQLMAGAARCWHRRFQQGASQALSREGEHFAPCTNGMAADVGEPASAAPASAQAVAAPNVKQAGGCPWLQFLAEWPQQLPPLESKRASSGAATASTTVVPVRFLARITQPRRDTLHPSAVACQVQQC
jgi:hypothetical protein